MILRMLCVGSCCGLQQVYLSKALVDNGMAAGVKKSFNVFRVSENIVTFAKF